MVRVLESGDEDLDAAVERASGGVVGSVGVLVGGHGLGLAVAGGVHGRGDAVLLSVRPDTAFARASESCWLKASSETESVCP